MSISAASPSLAERISAVILRVMACVAGRVRPAPAMSETVGEPIPPATEDLVHPWLARQRRLIAGLMERIAAGRLPEPRPIAPRAPAPRAPAPQQQPRTPPPRRPRGFGWLSALVAEAGMFGEQLSLMIAGPEMRAMCRATPRMGQLVRPVLHALGQTRPIWMAPPPRPRQHKPHHRPWPDQPVPDPQPPAVPAHVPEPGSTPVSPPLSPWAALHAAAVAGWDGRSPAPGGPYRSPFEPPDLLTVAGKPVVAERRWVAVPIFRRRW